MDTLRTPAREEIGNGGRGSRGGVQVTREISNAS